MMQIIRMVKRLKHVTLWRQPASQPATLHCSTIIILLQNNQVHSFLSQHGISANFPFPHCDFLPLQFVSLLFVNTMYLGPPNGTRVIKTNYDDFWYARFVSCSTSMPIFVVKKLLRVEGNPLWCLHNIFSSYRIYEEFSRRQVIRRLSSEFLYASGW